MKKGSDYNDLVDMKVQPQIKDKTFINGYQCKSLSNNNLSLVSLTKFVGMFIPFFDQTSIFVGWKNYLTRFNELAL